MARNSSPRAPVRPRLRAPATLLAAALILPAAPVHANSLPRWELGVGLGVLSLPFYRGAAKGRTYILPFPYVEYRGKLLKIDDEGIRGYLFHSDRARLNFNLAAGVPVPSDSSGVRRDMPKLKPTVEFGPSLEVLLWSGPSDHRNLWLKMPLRSAFAVGWINVAQQGWIFAPYVEYDTRHGHSTDPWLFSISAGPQFADSDYHDYFYEVAPRYATASRPEYHPGGGYSGSRVTVTAQRRWGDISLAAFVRYDTLQGAAFVDSPLVKRRDYTAMGFAVIKLLAVSKESEERP